VIASLQGRSTALELWPEKTPGWEIEHGTGEWVQKNVGCNTRELDMKKITLLCFTLLLLTASSALSQRVDYTIDYATDFSKFKTYKWAPVQTQGAIDNLTVEQIKALVDTALAQKGLTKVDADTADLLIDYQSRELISTPVASDPNDKPLTTYQGDLAIDMYTPAKHHLVWRGVASKALDPKANPEKRQKNLDKAVAKIMKNYPPPK
jgi:hypothetical protein